MIPNPRRLARRKLLEISLFAPLGVAVAACSGPAPTSAPPRAPNEATPEPSLPTPVAAPEPPFLLPAGEDRRSLMAGTAFETPLYVFASGKPGKIVLALGGVHGNEPAGWLAAERLVAQTRPSAGALLVVPHANKVADTIFERTTPQLGDLNRSYPGFVDGLPMERMAVELCDVMREFRVDIVHDMHESWAFYRDRTVNGTAFLGQTIATNPIEPGFTLVGSVVQAVNRTVLYPREEFSLREFPPSGQPGQSAADNRDLPRQGNVPPGGRGTSSLGLSRYFPGMTSILVEMGQQQELERRIALHVGVLREVLREVGVLAG